MTIGFSPGGGVSAPRGGTVTPAKEVPSKVDFSRVLVRLRTNGYHVTVRVAQGGDCVAHSYGTVQGFFRSNPCSSLSRAVFELRDRHKNVILLALSQVDMPSVAAARSYKALVDRDATGNITELSRESGAYRSVRYTGDFYASSLDGRTVRNAQVQPVGWWPAAALLNSIRSDALP